MQKRNRMRRNVTSNDDDDEGAPPVRLRWRCQSVNVPLLNTTKTTWSGLHSLFYDALIPQSDYGFAPLHDLR